MAVKRILLVEDEPAIYDLLELILRREGYVVEVATTAIEAKVLLDGPLYDLVICEWRLPDGNGTRIADAAAALGSETVLMTDDLQMPGDKTGRHATLMKPLRPSEIVAHVEGRIGKARGVDRLR